MSAKEVIFGDNGPKQNGRRRQYSGRRSESHTWTKR